MVMIGQTPFPHAKVSKEAKTEAPLPEILTAEEPTSALQEQLADILDNYLELLEQGQPEQAEALLTRQPHLEEPLREYLAGLKLLRAGTGPDDGSDATLPNLLQIRLGVPAKLGEFELLREIGRGGMGVVYEARQISLDRKVAVKVMHLPRGLDDKQRIRFENEARAAALLSHPHIVPVYAVGHEGAIHYYAMRYIQGGALRDAMDSAQAQGENSLALGLNSQVAVSDSRSRRLAILQALAACSHRQAKLSREHCTVLASMFRQAALALQAAHELGVVHRDVKPSNLLLDMQGALWITDFGLARAPFNDCVTGSGDILGTLQYMSPEQARGNKAFVDHRSDIYSLGVTMYEALASTRPFEGEHHAEMISTILSGRYKPLGSMQPGIPADLVNVVTKAMSLEPSERYPSAAALAEDLQRFMEGKATLARPPGMLQGALRWASRRRAVLLAALAVSSLVSVILAAAVVIVSYNASSTQQKLDANRTAFEQFGIRTAEWLRETPGASEVRRQVLTQVLNAQRQLLSQVGETPQLRGDHAMTLAKIAALHAELGDYPQAIANYQAAQLRWQDLSEKKGNGDSPPGSANPAVERAICLNQLGLLHSRSGHPDAALAALQEALVQSPGAVLSTELLAQQAQAWQQMSACHADKGHIQQAIECGRSAVALLDSILEQKPHNLSALSSMASACNRLAELNEAAAATHQAAQTELWKAKEEDARRRLFERAPNHLGTLQSLALERQTQGKAALRAQDWQAAQVAMQELVDLRERIYAESSQNPEAASELTFALSGLAQSLDKLGRKPEAIAKLRRAAEVQEAAVKQFLVDSRLLGQLAGVYNNLAISLLDVEEGRPSLAYMQLAADCGERACTLQPNDERLKESLAETLTNFSKLLRERNQPFAAAECLGRRLVLSPPAEEAALKCARELVLCVALMPEGDERRDPWVRKGVDLIDLARQQGATVGDKDKKAFASLLKVSQ